MNEIANTIGFLETRRKNDKIAIHALKKQIGMKVKRTTYPNAYCPVCNTKTTEFASKMLCDNYCRNCGQALDWSED